MTYPPRQSSWLTFGLNLLGIVVVGYSAFTYWTAARPAWLAVAIVVSLAAWLMLSVMRLFDIPYRLPVEFVMLIGGAFATGGTNGVGIVMVVIAVMFATSQVDRPILIGLGMAAIALIIVPFGALPFDQTFVGVLSMEIGVILGALAGVSRRQYREGERQNILLRERELDVRAEHDRAELLAERQGVARDIHDVLAHSLGGLVIQLDAVEALLESGDVSGAQKRVTDARALAASGLGEARRAVAALRESADEPVEPLTPEEFAAGLADLVAAHRSLGGEIEFGEAGSAAEVPAAVARAIERALQESLSNARKHAPGTAVTVELEWTPGEVRLSVANPVVVAALAVGAASAQNVVPSPGLGSSGGGHGLTGMRERFAALPLGGSVSAQVEGARFVVDARARLR